MRTAQDLLTELNASDESPRIEAKRARELGKSIMEPVIALPMDCTWAFRVLHRSSKKGA
jgi:hypothetical protein